MGQIRGMNNSAVSRGLSGDTVWVGASDAPWMNGGSHVAIRRFRMLLDKWESTPEAVRDRVFGRYGSFGAPLGAQHAKRPRRRVRDARPRRSAPEMPFRRVASAANVIVLPTVRESTSRPGGSPGRSVSV
ncbi:hypothetical protein [Curtobacterium sp. 1544]|uniref:hypothetical protein n=1 Tax=Curtobacterium sp. 1544 TaxID=3156417 RepID=UPI003398D04D